MAVQTLVMDPIWNSEVVVAGDPVARFSVPYAASASSSSRPGE